MNPNPNIFYLQLSRYLIITIFILISYFEAENCHAQQVIGGGAWGPLAVCTDGTGRAWGDNTYGQIGDNTNTQRNSPVQVSGLSGLSSIAGGFSNSLGLKSDGSVWSWGENGSGQIGDNTTTNRRTPVQVVTGASGCATYLCNITQIASGSGWYFSIALKSDGTVWAWGENTYGSLGNNSTTNRRTPVRVSGLTAVTAIATGGTHTMALKTDGSVWSWGYNAEYELGDNTTVDRTTAVQPTGGMTGVSAIGAGYYNSYAVKSTGVIWAWGYNPYGQIGDNTTTTRRTPVQVSGLSGVTSVAAGMNHAVALKSDGTVWSWGDNTYGQIGDNTTTERRTAVQVSGLSGVIAIKAGWDYSVALKSDYTLWVWGDGQYGQIGDNTTNARRTPVQPNGLCVVKSITATPVELLNFYAVCKKGTAELNWSTATETNSNTFTVQRSKDAWSWETAGIVPAAGYSSSIVTYSYQDDVPVSYMSYYRLIETDYDGQTQYFGPISATCKGDLDELIVFNANVVHQQLSFTFSTPQSGKHLVRIYNAMGDMVQSYEKHFDKGISAENTSVSGYAAGIYIIYMQSQDKSAFKKILIASGMQE